MFYDGGPLVKCYFLVLDDNYLVVQSYDLYLSRPVDIKYSGRQSKKEARTIRTLSVSVVVVTAHGQDARQFFGCRFLVTTVSTSPTGNPTRR